MNILDYMVYGNCPNLTDVYCKFPEGRASKFISNWKAGIADKLHFEEAQIPETQKYFAYTLDTTTNTATITGLNKDFANIVTGSSYYYTAIKDENNNFITDIVIPSKIVGEDDGIEYTVTTIGARAFRGGPVWEAVENSFTSIVIPDTVIRIEAYAFQACKKLTSVTMSKQVQSIGEEAFSYCESLTAITLPSTLTTLGTAAFMSTSSNLTITVDKIESECSSWPSGWNGSAKVVYKTAN